MQEESPNHLGGYVHAHVLPKGMTVTKAAKVIGIGRPALSNFLNGKAALSPNLAARLQKAFGANAEDLMRHQREYEALRQPSEQSVSATTRTFVPPLLQAKANDIETWADSLASRSKLAVLLRILVNSTCGDLKLVDFPGNDDAERPGWDGKVETGEGNPWVAEGLSGWEFGTGIDITKKANRDYKSRTQSVPEGERRRITFVFVSPRRWMKKEAWVREKREAHKWKNVLAWDSSDIEQWLDQSIPGQSWFANQRGFNLRGAKSLDRCWVEWCADCDPCFEEEIFDEAISEVGPKVREHLSGRTNGMLRIACDSHQEGLAFLWALFKKDNSLGEFRDKAVVFTEPGPLSELAVGSPGFLPVVVGQDVEREFTESGSKFKGLVVEPRSAARHGESITLEPLSNHAFCKALTAMGLRRERVEGLERESGRSLTVLRRRLAQNPTVRSPKWISNKDLAQGLLPLMLAGAWKVDNDADGFLVCQLAGRNDFEEVDRLVTEMELLEDSPVWSAGGFQGVVSKIDALYAVSRWMTGDQVSRFLTVAEIVLAERDPSLDLPEDQQWAAPIFGKAREISPALRKGIAESLVLLAIHGNKLFGERLGRNFDFLISTLVRGLLEPMSAETLISQCSNLPLYAEAAPDEFLSIFERDIASGNPVVVELMNPAGDILFGRHDRVNLLWALELLAWHPKWLDRAVTLLSQLAEMEPNDNLANKPSASLQSIFRSWMPQTAAHLEHRISAFDRLVEGHPKQAWRISAHQFAPASDIGEHTQKPKWRDYAHGTSEVATADERCKFIHHCIETCLNWSSHTRETLEDLISNVNGLRCGDLPRLETAVAKWADGASERDRAGLREHTRFFLRIKPNVNSEEAYSDELILFAQNLTRILEPKDPVWKYAWLFRTDWIQDSRDEIEDGVDFALLERRNKSLRLNAMREVISTTGHAGVLQLAFTGTAPDVAGRTAAEVIVDEPERLAFVRNVVADSDSLTSLRHQALVAGFLEVTGTDDALDLIDALWPEYGEDVGVKLLCLVRFGRPVWTKVERMSDSLSNKYWASVQPFSRDHTAEDTNYVVSRLLESSRALAAMNYARFDWEYVESGLIRRVLTDLPGCDELAEAHGTLDQYRIEKAFNVLNERQALSRGELARLEFLYIDIFWLKEGSLPNLEREIEANPEILSEAISLAYKPQDSKENRKLSDSQVTAGRMAQRLLIALSRVPGHDADGILNAKSLERWVRRVRELCEANGRPTMGDQHIGQLLSKAPVGEDGIWPCIPVRQALNRVLNKHIGLGFQIGRRNSRGVHKRIEGGTQERELAEQYEGWAKACDDSYPRVATELRDIANSYRQEAHWEDQEAAVQKRLGY